MKLVASAKLVVIGMEKGEYQGKPTYKIGVSQDAQCATIKCTEELFSTLERFKEYNLELIINDQYSSITATRILYPMPNSNPTGNKEKGTDKQ